MRSLKILSMLVLVSLISCGKADVKTTDMAVQAMERARAAEADIYAPQEYSVAADLFQQMQEAMDAGDLTKADEIATAVIEAANKATEIARQNKATTLIAELKRMLETAQKLGVDKENPDIYTQAVQLLIDAEGFYSIPDYEKSAEAAQSGIDLLEPLVGGAEALALANLNRARDLLDRAYRSTDLTQTEVQLTEASNIIEQAAREYQDKDYASSLNSSQTAIDMLEKLIAEFPGDGAISIEINDDENLQLQAYDLIRRLGAAIEFIKTNNYTQDVYTDSSKKSMPLTPLTPATKVDENALTNSTDMDTNGGSLIEEEDIEIFLYEDGAIEEIDTILYEDGAVEEIDTTLYEDGTLEYEETIYEYEDDVEAVEEEDDELAYLPLEFKAQDQTELMTTDETMPVETEETIEMNRVEPVNTASGDKNVITVQMIEDFYTSSQNYYNEGNYLNAIDQAREGLRLSELYLAGQILTTHKVIRRDTLWDISKKYYKTPWLWPNIWRANKLEIKDPDLIYPGQEFKIPPASTNSPK